MPEAVPAMSTAPADAEALASQLESALRMRSIERLRARLERLAGKLETAAPHLAGELRQAAGARTMERARYYLRRSLRGLRESRPLPYSDLDLNRWKAYDEIRTDSLWLIDRRDRSGSHRADYWGNYVPEIPRQMLARFTRPGDWVLDPFTGSGTTLIECRRAGRHALGTELQPAMAIEAQRRVDAEPDPHGVVTRVMAGDAREADWGAALAAEGASSAQLLLLHPPYHDIIRFSEDPRDLSNTGSVEDFLDALAAVATPVVAVLERGRYAALVIGDKYAGGEWIPLGFLAMQRMQALGLRLKSIVVKNFEQTTAKRNQEPLWRYRALAGGFYVFRHEYVFVFVRD